MITDFLRDPVVKNTTCFLPLNKFYTMGQGLAQNK